MCRLARRVTLRVLSRARLAYTYESLCSCVRGFMNKAPDTAGATRRRGCVRCEVARLCVRFHIVTRLLEGQNLSYVIRHRFPDRVPQEIDGLSHLI